MARSQEVQFLRARASRLREIAGTARTALSDPLRMMVNELEARADELERAYKPGDDSCQDRARGVRAAERLGRGLERGGVARPGN